MFEQYKLLDWIELDKIDWYWLSYNPNAIHILEANPSKINWPLESTNTNFFLHHFTFETPINRRFSM